jgi:hypothetical protein
MDILLNKLSDRRRRFGSALHQCERASRPFTEAEINLKQSIVWTILKMLMRYCMDYTKDVHALLFMHPAAASARARRRP